MQKDFADHLQRIHLSDRQIFKYWHYGLVPFVPETNTVKVHVIDAFNKNFLFFYVSFASSSVVHFVVQLLGRKCDAEKYMVEFEVGAELKKMKFIEPCYSDAIDLLNLLNTKQTMTIPKDYFKQYANASGEIRFQLFLKRKTAVIEENRQKEEYFKATMLTDLNMMTRVVQGTSKASAKSAPAMQKQSTSAAAVKAKNNAKQFKNKNK